MEIKNAKYANAENTIIDVEIEHPVYGWIPYTFNVEEEDTGFDAEIREWLKTATIEAYTDPTLTEQQQIANQVAEYKTYLASTDYIVTKLAEYTALGKDTSELLTKYATKLETRDEYRTYVDANDVSNS